MEKLVLGWVGKTQNLKNIQISNRILYIVSHMWSQKWSAVQYGFDQTLNRTASHMWLQKQGTV